jgi:UDP-N-acetylmuramate--alanine ligase
MSLKPQKIFFSGIGGSGMSAIACFMADKGHMVAGSDRAFDQNPRHPVYRLLRSKGITIVPQDGSGIDSSFDLAVFSTAVEPDQPEVMKAKALGIPLRTRPEYLADIVKAFRTIAVAGTSGKSTTSGMLAFLMERLGLKPNFIGGGRVKQFMTEQNPGNSLTGDSDLLVMEACESDGTIVNYTPVHSIVLNLDLDHHPVETTAGMFSALIKNTPGMVIVNGDDRNLRGLTPKGIRFSADQPSGFLAKDIIQKEFSTEFSVRSARFTLSIPGRHNLYNALPCIAFLHEIGIPLKDISSHLREFRGIERRFDIHLNDGKHLVIDDYAHNPHKISSLMETMKHMREAVCYIFQPHGFAPTRTMKKEYIEAFTQNLRDSDHLILLPIFYAGGTVSKDISSHDLVEEIRSRGRSAEVIERRETILDRMGEWDTCVIFGARDETLSDFAKSCAQVLHGRKSVADS